MRLLHLDIENFGRLQGYSLDLREGLNVLHEKNGWGKSTLAVFIKAMLYGLPASTKRSLDRNERKKYAPWQGGAYGGSLEFECEKGRFRVERIFAAREADDEFRLFDLSTNRPSSAFSPALGTELLGIDAEGFERSAYLSQQGMDLQEGNASVTAKLTGLLEEVNDMGSFEEAVRALDRRRQYYEVKGGRGRVPDLQRELSEQKADLEQRRARLPGQEQLERELAECLRQRKLAEQEEETLRRSLERAGKESARREEYERMRQRLQDAERQRQELLDAFRDRQLPTDAELSDARARLQDYRTAQAAREACRLSERESAELERLRRAYPPDGPAGQALKAVQENLQHLTDAGARLRAAQTPSDTPEQRRFRGTGIPSQPMLDEAAEQLRRADELQKQIHEAQNTQPPPARRRIPLPVPVAALLAAAAAGIAGLALTAYRVPLLAACGVLALVGVLTLILGGKHTDTSAVEAEQQLAASLKAEQEKLLSFVRGLLTRYGMLPASGDFRAALAELKMLAARAQADAARQQKQQADAEALRLEAEGYRMAVAEGLRSFGVNPLPADPQEALLRIRAELNQRRQLSEKQAQAERRLAEADADLRARQENLGAFLGRLTERTGNQPEQVLSRMEYLVQEHARLLEETGRQRRELQRFGEQNRLEESATGPDAQELRARLDAQKRRLEELREQETDGSRRLDRLTAQTQDIPALEDLVNSLSEELRTAQDNLDTLRRTESFLSESREALSTRYLDGMQRHFTHYCALLGGADAPAAQLDTALSVTVREGGRSQKLESYSRGSRDMLLFCARLALTRAMFPAGEAPFLLLDDPFVNLDEEHLSAARALLDRLAEELQILYFVCHVGRA